MVTEKGEGKPTDNRSAPTAHISSKLTERLSLRDNTQADYHPQLGHVEMESSLQEPEPEETEQAEPPCPAP